MKTKWPKIPPAIAVPIKAVARLMLTVIGRKEAMVKWVLERSQWNSDQLCKVNWETTATRKQGPVALGKM